MDPFHRLIDNAIGRLNIKLGGNLKYVVEKRNFAHTFTIYDGDVPLLFKEIPDFVTEEQVSLVHYEIVKDFFMGSVERIYEQRKQSFNSNTAES